MHSTKCILITKCNNYKCNNYDALRLKPSCSDSKMPPKKGAMAAAAKDKAAVAAEPAVTAGEMRKAIAFRVKYRVATGCGNAKRRLAIKILGVHPKNRGGVYPQGDVAKGLAAQLADKGFVQEVADHMGVCVQEPPPEHRITFVEAEASDDASAAVAVTTYTAYNKMRCQGQPVLESCFDDDSNVLYG